MKKQTKDFIFNKFNGKCAYSGTDLEPNWEVEHKVSKLYLQRTGGDINNVDNLLPVQKLINNYKRSLSLEEFRTWYLGKLHERLKKLPKNPRTEKGRKRKEYLLKVADYFGITENKPFSGVFYFETINCELFEKNKHEDGC